MSASSDVTCETAALQASPGFEDLFYAHHERITRVITRIIRDPGRAEEVAVEVFWKFWRTPKAHGPMVAGWLHRAAVRMSLNELRRQVRETKKEGIARRADEPPNPERVFAASQEQEHVRTVLAAIRPRDAELLLLRSTGLSYEGLAAALALNPVSVGTLLSRAQQAFRKEYVKRFGDTGNER